MTPNPNTHITSRGVEIGRRPAPLPSMDPDALRLQRALIGQRSTATRVFRTLLQALKGGSR